MFSLFGRRKAKSNLRPPRGPGETIRPEDRTTLQNWAAGRAHIEAYIEPETLINEMSVVLVDERGEFIRRRIGGPKGIDAVQKLLKCPVFDVEETGYPQRMRTRIERDRLLRKREEQKTRRAKFERGELPD
ncbi:oxidoreductase [Corynebacterium sp. A21]|uniref:oxidoreductase n=1 Tax=Corynebacterium sp. A21 TaxID=3457318 RepID=UPI003FD39E9F